MGLTTADYKIIYINIKSSPEKKMLANIIIKIKIFFSTHIKKKYILKKNVT